MAQRKSPNASNRPARPANQRPAGQPRPAGRPSGSTATKPPARKPGKSIVNQKQTPWGLIITTIVLIVFAGGIVAYAVTRTSSSSPNAAPSANTNPADNKFYVQPEVAAAKSIPGIIWHVEPNHDHTTGLVKYDMSPPIGGNHAPYWADCQGTVYTTQIANENAVHMLEHGAVWITYNPKTATASDIAALKNKVDGVDRMAMSPYAGLKTPISLQAWNYQLFVKSATDPRIDEFIDALRYKKDVTPEPSASCSDPYFKASNSHPGHPFEG